MVFVIASHAALITSQLCLYLICIYFHYSASFQTLFFLSLHYPSENTASLFSRSPAAVLHLSPNLPLTHRGLTDLGISTPQQLFPNTATGASVCARYC